MVGMSKEEKCSVCGGSGYLNITQHGCLFCNGTGEQTQAAMSYMKFHICQCDVLDRKNCPLCGKKCHHNTPLKPHILIIP